ncbi:MAG: putative ABC transport system permease protein [Arcticibacterium sp.]|jgi:putative ABC transport system permease protein
MTLAQGRNFMKDQASDDKAVIINQELAKKLVLDEPIGKRISRNGDLYEISWCSRRLQLQ